MPSTKVIQRSFAGGEISPQMFGRIDDAKYATGLETCLNFMCLPQGPIQNRPGLAYVAKVKDSTKPVRLLPFTFNYDQTMVIELGDKYARFHTDGATLMNAEGTAPYEIETPWAAEDLFDIHYVQSADIMTLVHPNYPPTELRRYSAYDWRTATVDFGWKLEKPTNVRAERATAAAEDKNADKYKFRYVVSCLNNDKTIESEAVEATYVNSDTKITDGVVANLYQYGTTVRVSCDEVPGASFYRFYKCQGGLFGYIGDSDTPSIIDDDIDPDMSITPRRYADVFQSAKGISSVDVLTGGSGYEWYRGAVSLPDPPYSVTSVGVDDVLGDLAGFQLSRVSGSNFSQSSSGYPAYPSAPEITATITDGGGNGSGATAECEVEVAHGRTQVKVTTGRPGVNYHTEYRSISTSSLKSIKITNVGSNYIRPQLTINWWTVRSKKTDSYEHYYYAVRFDLDAFTGGTELMVTDETGTGAILRPVIQDGVIQSVIVVQGGSNYTNPTITAISSTGSGATFKANIGLTGNYPAAVGYYEQRRVFAGLSQNPQRVIMSCSGTEDDFTYSLPVRDSDRIDATVSVTQFDGILHVVPLAQLLLLTTGSEVRVSPVNSDSLTPSSFSARPQSFIGCSNVQPVLVNNNIIYCAARGGHVREFAYQYNAGGYVSGDLCLRSAHLFDFREIVDMAYAKAPFPVVWFVSSSGELLGLTYVPEQNVGSWHRHQTAGVFESCACVSEGSEDRLYVVVRRTINGQQVRFIERMASRQFEADQDAFFVDCGGTYRGDATSTIAGLNWLNGEEVSILADGAVLPHQKVVDGKIELDAPASIVHVGLPYVSDCKTLPVVLQEASFGMGMQKNVSKVTVRVHQSSGIFIGPSFEKSDLVEYKQRTTEQPGTPASTVTGEISVAVYPTWSDGGSICVRQEDPLPLSLLSLSMELSV